MMTTTAAAMAKMTMAMISNTHVALNRERKGGIVEFVFDSKLNNEPSAGTKSPKSNAARNSAENLK